MRRSTIALAALALATSGCAGGETNWAKPGVDSEKVADDYEACRAEARAATQRDAAIDSDILATRGNDWQRAGTLSVNKDANAAAHRSNAQSIIANCMAAKGYRPAE